MSSPLPSQPQTHLSWAKKPVQELMRLSWPMVVSLVSLSIMTLVDTLFIGWLGSTELAATGLGGVTLFAVASFGLALIGAAKVKVGERHGHGDVASVHRALGAFLRLALALGLASVFLGQLAAWSLPLLSGDEDVGLLAEKYSQVRSIGLPFIVVSAAIGQWLQAQGDSKSSMNAALAANVVNIPLNAVLIFGFHWGVVGAACATAASRVVEAAWLVVIQLRREERNERSLLQRFHIHDSTWKDAFLAFRVGLPTGLERVLDMIAFAAVPLLLSQVGAHHVAAHQIVLQVMLFSFLPLIALSESVSILVSQAVGAKRMDIVKKVANFGMGLALVYALAWGGLSILLARQLVGTFTPDELVAEVATQTLVMGAVLQLVNAAYNQLKGVLRGLSVFRFVAWVTVLCAWIITPPLTLVLGVWQQHGAPGAWLAMSLEVSLGVAILWWRVRAHSRLGSEKGPVGHN